jgi:hypothetical protein
MSTDKLIDAINYQDSSIVSKQIIKKPNGNITLRNLSIVMRQIFYLFKQHFLMVNHPFGVYLSTPEHQAF